MSVKVARIATTATIESGPCRLLGLNMMTSGTTGSVTLKDGGASGTSKLVIDTAAATANHFVPIGGGGLQFDTDMHGTLSNVDAVTAIYEDL